MVAVIEDWAYESIPDRSIAAGAIPDENTAVFVLLGGVRTLYRVDEVVYLCLTV